jgi:short subunit dehydrogenase-like uncharacterized protein
LETRITGTCLVYGANGYTGRRIAAEAAARGLQPVLAGRDGAKIEPLAAKLNCASRVFSLTTAEQIAGHLEGIDAVLHCAGPFSATAAPMMEGCLAAGVHYLDITGEIDVIESAVERHGRAVAAGISLLPAVGMDVVPSDCLAARLAQMLPNAVKLELAFAGMLSISHGTAATIWENVGRGGRIRRAGQIVRVPVAWKTQEIPFHRGRRWAMTIPWGDIASAFHTTGIPDIEVYAAMPSGQLKVLRAFRWLAPLAGLKPIQTAGRWWIDHRIQGPGADELRQGRTEFWGRVTDAAGQSVEATLETPNGYTLTVQSSLAIVQQVLAGRVRPGFSTPALALGAEFIETIPDVVFRRG